MRSISDRVQSHGWELAVAGSWFLVGLAYATNTQYAAIHSPVARDLGWWQWVWSALYISAGPMIWYGAIHRRINWRVAGIILLGTGLTIQFCCALTGVIDFRTFTYAMYALFCVLKLAMLHGVYRKGRTYEL